MRTETDLLEQVFAYRAFDMHDRFPQPLETFQEALECLQSDRAYLAEESGKIIAYLRGGYALTIPSHFFLNDQTDNDVEVVSWKQNDIVCSEVEGWLRTFIAAHEKIK